MWVGDIVYSGWDYPNSVLTSKYESGGGQYFYTIALTAGTYLPIRLLYGDNGGPTNWNFRISDAANYRYSQTGVFSGYLVTKDCTGNKTDFPPFAIGPKPDGLCENLGLQGYVTDVTYPNNATHVLPGWNVTHFKTTAPSKTVNTTSIGCAYPCNSPQGLTTNNGNMALMYRGFFWAPRAATYTFNFTNVHSGIWLWTGSTAYSGWDLTNFDVSAVMASPSSLPANASWTIELEAQSYTPMRILYGDGDAGGSFTLEITDEDGNYYLTQDQYSDYLLGYVCDSDIEQFFTPWGQET
ncbi:hypothetical protein H072_5678 [Dactylellina haptotyla CBS 200.50]|uniref:PA14 domain-containing protein n=1 Tax=Dactylellina haptotyla (strain CBS 200.50) TaxID=1284197 RepID=S8BM05_DACHA|nr:hypothetical protein H072_5678 [Dactylellina haptotyla CBS 200.50]